jgi:hypothetical protein
MLEPSLLALYTVSLPPTGLALVLGHRDSAVGQAAPPLTPILPATWVRQLGGLPCTVPSHLVTVWYVQPISWTYCTILTEVCCAHCWCVHRDNYVSMYTLTVCVTCFSFYSVGLGRWVVQTLLNSTQTGQLHSTCPPEQSLTPPNLRTSVSILNPLTVI